MENYIDSITQIADVKRSTLAPESLEFIDRFFEPAYKDWDREVDEDMYSVEDFNEVLEREKPAIHVETELQVIHGQAIDNKCAYIRIIK